MLGLSEHHFFNPEKKVEYIELIYDLIFVYLIGRNNSLMDKIENGFIAFDTFSTYLITSLIILQIWYHSVMFVNRFGKNGVQEKIMMLVNMFLLYLMGSNTVNDWGPNYLAYMSAWVLIFVNMAVQYGLKLREAEDPELKQEIIRMISLLLLQATVALVSIPIYQKSGYAFGAWAMVIGYIGLFQDKLPVNFEHLSERMMLYVVFTFGEMVISVAGYFSGGFTFRSLYFALMSFLMVAGLFFSYGIVYDRLLDRSRSHRPVAYLILHVFLILSLGVTTNALEFMREPAVDSVKKTAMLLISLLIFFICLALTVGWSNRAKTRLPYIFLQIGLEFVIAGTLTLVLIESSMVAILITVLLIYVQLLTLYFADKRIEKKTE